MSKHQHHLIYTLLVSSLLLITNSFSEPTRFEFSPQDILIETGLQIDTNYVFPELGSDVSKHLKTLAASGEEQWSSDPDEFAKQVTEILQNLTNDKHLRVRWQDPRSKNKRVLQRLRVPPEKDNFGIQTIEKLEHNILLVKLTMFYSNIKSSEAIAATMKLIENADAVIWDIRENGGGDPQTVNQIFSHYMNPGIDYITFYDRDANIRRTMTTREELDAKRNLEVPVYILTSGHSFSAAEEFAYNFKSFGRGTVIGETTGGGANPGDRFPVGSNFQAFVPMGRPINPITKTNWEGVGVKPDVDVPADEALDKAIEIASAALSSGQS